MNTKALRQKVLDLAIHGKLVPQNPNDESATVLLEKIRAEKAEKIKKGELKADKKDSFIFVGSDKRHYEQFADGTVKDIEDEIPFDVPEGWAWCRLGNIGKWQSGTTPNKKNLDYYKNGTIPWLLTGDLNDGLVTEIPNCITEKALKETSLKINPIGSVCIAMYGATIGKLGILNTPATTNQACCVCYEFYGINNKYLFYFLKEHKEEFIQQGFGGAQPNISKEKIVDTFIPLPPLSEQECIVKSIETYFEQIDSLEENKYDLQTAIKQAKSKILDLAIHGKLVPQDPNDEPAEELLKRIATSDNRPYKKFDDEEPFEIPYSWAWASMKDIVTINPKNKIDDDAHVSFIPMTLIDSEYKNTHGQEEKLWKDIKKGFTHFAENDVAIAKISPCFENRKSVVLKNLKNGYGAGTTELYILRSKDVVLPEYILWLVKSDNFINTGIGNFSGVVGQQRLARDIVENYPVPLPPFAEQQRIVSKIEELFEKLDIISKELTE